MNSIRQNIKALIPGKLEKEIVGLGLRKYRAKQVFEWIYGHHVASFDEMTNLAKAERLLLAERFYISHLRVLKTECSADGTRKFLFELEDKHTIESVLIPDEDRSTLCISSQVGCAQACRFCLTGSTGFRRNLEAFEIADQVLAVAKILAEEPTGGRGSSWEQSRHITNIVLMGMGEPLANFDNVLNALMIITADKGPGFSPRRVTLSTDGLVPEIERLGKSGIKVNLAVSLNATTDEVRDRIMPVNRRYPIKELFAACRRFPLGDRRRITFEYVMLRELNDSEADALRLVKLLRGIRCKVNLIPFNPFPGSEFKRPDDAVVQRFKKILADHHYTALVRESRGRDISAACGQLREGLTPGSTPSSMP
jgi:23S rRNA (adenine2503-C2)-methyltransferase